MSESSAPALLATKLVAPVLPLSLVRRGRLERLLDAAVDGAARLVLVTAPAGSGKSTLVAGWAADRPESSAWLQLDPSDDDPLRFWRYLVGAIAAIRPAVREALGPLLASPAGVDGDLVAEALAAALVDTDPLVVVLDDYHLVGDDAVHVAVERLVGLVPVSVTLVIATRVDPPLRLGRLRVRGQLVEVRAADLRFDADEASPLLGASSATLDVAQVAALCDRTEGWAAGLVLAGLSLDAATDADAFVRGFHGDDRLVVDYLTDELLSVLPTEELDRLLRTSVLERMHGELVDAVCGTDDGARWLREAAAANQLIVGLDSTGTWFRYHHLLRDLLRSEAEALLGEALVTAHRRAGEWHAAKGSPHQAVEHLIAGGALETAADLIWDEATELLNNGLLRSVSGQIDRLGPLADEHAGVVLIRGYIAQMTGRHHEASTFLEQARALRSTDPEIAGMVEALAIITALSAGDVAAALAVTETGVDPIDPAQALARAARCTWAGRFDEARPHIEVATETAERMGDSYTTTVAPILGAIAAVEHHDVATARRLALRALDAASGRRFRELAQFAPAHSIVGRTDPDREAAVASVRRGVELARRAPEPLVLGYALASAGDVLAALDDPEAEALVREARRVVDRCVDPGIAGSYVARVESRHGIAGTARSTSVDLVEELTDRELAVLRYLPSRLSQREIAAELYVSLNTVKTHSRAVYRKLGVDGRKAAVQVARDIGLL